jgi:hypothetical protein
LVERVLDESAAFVQLGLLIFIDKRHPYLGNLESCPQETHCIVRSVGSHQPDCGPGRQGRSPPVSKLHARESRRHEWLARLVRDSVRHRERPCPHPDSMRPRLQLYGSSLCPARNSAANMLETSAQAAVGVAWGHFIWAVSRFQ